MLLGSNTSLIRPFCSLGRSIVLGADVQGQDKPTACSCWRNGKTQKHLSSFSRNLRMIRMRTNRSICHPLQWASIYTSKGYHHTCGRTNLRKVRKKLTVKLLEHHPCHCSVCCTNSHYFLSGFLLGRFRIQPDNRSWSLQECGACSGGFAMYPGRYLWRISQLL